MRVIQTFILRLLVDADHPEAMCGALHVVNENGEPRSFRNQAELITLLERLHAEQLKVNPGTKKRRTQNDDSDEYLPPH